MNFMTLSELNKKALSLPEQPGCYLMKDKNDEIIYIGKAKKLKNRVTSYFRAGAVHDAKTSKMVSCVDHFNTIITDSEYEALVLECSLIKQHMPKFNILLKDDKGFCYIRISRERYPRITAEFKKKEDGARYLGPYYSAYPVRRMVDTANIVFGLPTCGRVFPRDIGKDRPCLNFHIGKCRAVCSGAISEEEYNKTVGDAITLLSKGAKTIVAKLREDMQTASDNLEFEKAARMRDSINAILKQEDGQKIIKNTSDNEFDVFAFAGNEKSVCAVVLKFRDGKLSDKDEQVLFDTTSIDDAREEFLSHYYIYNKDVPRKILVDYSFESMDELSRMLSEQEKHNILVAVPQRGENHALVAMAYNNANDRLKREAGRKSKDEAALGELANLLGLTELPKRIEAYDISNYGDEAVAGMTVFVNGIPRKTDYRRFIIKTVEGVDDYASMAETLIRRAKRFETRSAGFAIKPDVILIDGGRGHLTAATEALSGTELRDVRLFGMVKDDKHRTRGVVAKEGELEVALHKSAFSLVTKIQDETHRFTVGYQRERHTRTSLKSSLTNIEGIGDTRAKEIMKALKTLDAVKSASVEELTKIKGMSASAAKAVYDFFNT